MDFFLGVQLHFTIDQFCSFIVYIYIHRAYRLDNRLKSPYNSLWRKPQTA